MADCEVAAGSLAGAVGLAFVSDEQIAVIDLRPLQPTEALWLLRQYSNDRLPPSEREQVLLQLGRLTMLT